MNVLQSIVMEFYLIRYDYYGQSKMHVMEHCAHHNYIPLIFQREEKNAGFTRHRSENIR